MLPASMRMRAGSLQQQVCSTWVAAPPVRVPRRTAAHPFVSPVVPPQESDLYWMVSNVNRDSNRKWKQPERPDSTNPSLHITAFRCVGGGVGGGGGGCGLVLWLATNCAPQPPHFAALSPCPCTRPPPASPLPPTPAP